MHELTDEKNQTIKTNRNNYNDKTKLSQSTLNECILKPVKQGEIYPEPGGRIR
jgi:hypothetical protein